jgi:hypothetical protein
VSASFSAISRLYPTISATTTAKSRRCSLDWRMLLPTYAPSRTPEVAAGTEAPRPQGYPAAACSPARSYLRAGVLIGSASGAAPNEAAIRDGGGSR